MLFTKEIAKLKADLVAAEEKLGSAVSAAVQVAEDKFASEKAGLEARITELETVGKEAITKADHDAALLLKDGEIEELQGQLKAAEKNVDLKVVEKIAEAGVPAAVRDPKAIDNPAQPTGGNGQTPTQRLAAATKISGSKK